MPETQDSPAAPAKRRWRSVLSVTLVVVGCALAVAAAGMQATTRLVLDTDHWVKVVGPLSAEPAVANALSLRLTEGLFEAADVEGQVGKALPDQVGFLSPVLTDVLAEQSAKITERAIATDEFNTLWTEANRIAHRELVVMVDTAAGRETSEPLVLKLDKAYKVVATALTAAGIVDDDQVQRSNSGDVQLLSDKQADNLVETLELIERFDRLAAFAWTLMIISFAAAIVLSPRRMYAVATICFSLAATAGLMIVGINVARPEVVGLAPTPEGAAATEVVYDAFTATPSTSLLTALILLAFAGVVALSLGPSQTAVAFRASVASATASARAYFGRVFRWKKASMAEHTRAWQVGGLVAAFVVLLAWPEATIETLLVIVGLLAVYMAGVSIMAGAAEDDPTADDAS